jgi:ribonucleoside-diphosphate reductase alpha chain
MDDTVDLEIEKIEKILDKIEKDPEQDEIKLVEFKLWLKIRQKAVEGRRTGLGITAEGDMLAAIGLRYGTKEATEFSVNIHKIMAVESYISSIQLAGERGTFPIWDLQKEKQNPFLGRILVEANNSYPHNAGDGGDYGVICDYYDLGRRNISNLTCAPTGTVSLMSQTSSGIEPVFKAFYKRKRKVEKETDKTTKDHNGDIWEEYFVMHPKFVEWYMISILKNELDFKGTVEWLSKYSEEFLNRYFKESPYYKATANDIDWKESIRMQGEVQKWIDHSISKTVNLPSETTIDQVDELYRLAHARGCKGVTIYREGSREGVLTSIEKKKENFEYERSIIIPKERECDIYHKTAMKKSWMIVVGKVDGKPVEIFALEDLENHVFPSSITKGILKKEKSKVYSLTSKDSDKVYKIKNIVDLMTDTEGVDTRKYSLMLRHRINPQFIIDQIREYATITSFDKVIERVLMMYIKEERKGKEKCPECGEELTRQDGCVKCVSCGWSKCG